MTSAIPGRFGESYEETYRQAVDDLYRQLRRIWEKVDDLRLEVPLLRGRSEVVAFQAIAADIATVLDQLHDTAARAHAVLPRLRGEIIDAQCCLEAEYAEARVKVAKDKLDEALREWDQALTKLKDQGQRR